MPVSTQQFYNRIAPLYPAIDFFLKPQRKKLIQEVNRQKPGRLLEIGIGNGSYLSQYKGHQVTGIDTSVAMLKQAHKYKKEHVELLEMGGDDLQFKEATFDYVVLSHVIAVVEKPDLVLDEVFKVLKPKGKVFILNHFTPDNWLQFIDKTFHRLSRTVHFNSFFSLDHLKTMDKFTMVKQMSIGKLSYFKLLILEKP